MNWINIKCELPTIFTVVLTRCKIGDNPPFIYMANVIESEAGIHLTVAASSDFEHGYAHRRIDITNIVSHWQPMPSTQIK